MAGIRRPSTRRPGPVAPRRFFPLLGQEQKAKEEPIQKTAQPPPLPVEVDGPITVVHSEEDLMEMVKSGIDMVVELAFTWCRPCKTFAPRYKKFANVYSDTRFVKITGNENESCKHYARDVLRAKISPMFAAYSGGKLVNTWNGANNGRFVEKLEDALPTAKQLAHKREAAIEADSSLAPTTPAKPPLGPK